MRAGDQLLPLSAQPRQRAPARQTAPRRGGPCARRLLGAHPPVDSAVARLTLADVAASKLSDRFELAGHRGEIFRVVRRGQPNLYDGRVVIAEIDGEPLVGRFWVRRSDQDEVTVCIGDQQLSSADPTTRLAACAD